MSNIIQTFWHGSDLDELGYLSLKSFVKHGFTVNLWKYDSRIKNIPKGVNIRDASEILPPELVYCHVNGSYAPFSDWFRFALLYKEGGLWVDTDIICLKPFSVPDNTICGEVKGRPCIGFIALQKGHPLAKRIIYDCEDPRKSPTYGSIVREIVSDLMSHFSKEEARRRAPWSYTGNDLLVKLAKEYTLHELDPTDIYPIPYSLASTVTDGTVGLDRVRESKCVHLWRTALRRSDSTYTDSCLYNQLKQLTLN